MKYFTTMNLPAPTHQHFCKKLMQYWGNSQNAVADFEFALEAFFHVPKVMTWTNCFTAIALTLMHASRGRSIKVAISALAYRRTADIVKWAGLQPVFVDNSLQNLAMNIESLRETLRLDDIGCILMQHPMVNIVDVDAFISLANEFGVPIIFDSVEATGGYFRGDRLGKFGVAEVFSLHPSKVINAAEGGVLTFGSISNHTKFQKSMEELGIVCPDTGRQLLFGIEPIHAIMGLASLEIYNEVTLQHKCQYQQYKKNMQFMHSLEIIQYDDINEPNYKSILIKINTGAVEYRTRLLEFLENLRIGARQYYAPLHSDTKGNNLPNAAVLSEQYIILPIGKSVTNVDIDFICEKLQQFERMNFGFTND